MQNKRNTPLRSLFVLGIGQHATVPSQPSQSFLLDSTRKEIATKAEQPKETKPPQAQNAPAKQSEPPKQLRMVSTDVLLERAGISRSHLYALRKGGRCPRPIKLSPGRRGAVRYLEHEVDAWIESLMATRQQDNETSSGE